MDLEIHRREGLKDYIAPSQKKHYYYNGEEIDKAVFDLEKGQVRVYTGPGEVTDIFLDNSAVKEIKSSKSDAQYIKNARNICKRMFSPKEQKKENVRGEGKPEIPSSKVDKIPELKLKIEKSQSQLTELDVKINDLEMKYQSLGKELEEITEEELNRRKELVPIKGNKNLKERDMQIKAINEELEMLSEMHKKNISKRAPLLKKLNELREQKVKTEKLIVSIQHQIQKLRTFKR